MVKDVFKFMMEYGCYYLERFWIDDFFLVEDIYEVGEFEVLIEVDFGCVIVE